VVHLIEDDRSTRAATCRVLKSAGFTVGAYSTAADFLTRLPDGPGCLVLDLRLPGASGLDLQEQLAMSRNPLPVVFMTGDGDIPNSVRAMKAGAVDLLIKPVDAPVLLDAVSRALARDAESRANRAREYQARSRYSRLTPRERDVFAHLISGQLNKQVGFDLGISERTTKSHRHQIFEKMQANSIVDLVRMAADLRIAPAGKVR
jgi:FixJ family two-component response regulator